KSYLWLRPIDSITAEKLPGTDNPIFPFWSPDSGSLGFFSEQKLKRIDVSSKTVVDLCDVPDPRGGSWGADSIIFSPTCCDGLEQIPVNGGKPTPLTTLDYSKGEVSHRWPWFLPDGRHFVFLTQSGKKDVLGNYIGSLDSKKLDRINNEFSGTQYAEPGFLLYVHQGTLTAQQFDLEHYQLKGEPHLVAQSITFGSFGVSAASEFSVSQHGVLAYRTALANMGFHWLDRSGKDLGLATTLTQSTEPSFSPDEKRIALGAGPEGDIQLLDLATGRTTRFTFNPSFEGTPVWSPDGT